MPINTKSKLVANKGFALIELIIVMGMGTILFGFVAFNLIRFQGLTSSTSNINSMISDIRSQQLKAMYGSTEGRSTNDSYGVYFLTDRYVLFPGTVYDSGNSDNFEVMLPEDISIQGTTFPNNTIIFNKLSGEINGFSTGADTVTVFANNIDKLTDVIFNRYGVITEIE